MKSLEDWVKESAKLAADIFNKHGSLTPMWVAETESGELLPIVAPMIDKDALFKAIKKLFAEHKVKRYVFMVEAWTIVSTGRENWSEAEKFAENNSLEFHPDRREIIMVTGEEKGQSIMGYMCILRPEHGKPTVSPFKIEQMDRMEGRMSGLLPERT